MNVKIVNNGVVSRYPSRSLVYNAVDSGLAAAECTLWECAWLAKNCARVKYRLKLFRIVKQQDNSMFL